MELNVECEYCKSTLINGECWNLNCVPVVATHKKHIPEMFNITPWCKKYNRQPSHFLDNNCMIDYLHNVEIIRGRYGYTKIPGVKVPDFFLWLSEETKFKVVHNKLEELL